MGRQWEDEQPSQRRRSPADSGNKEAKGCKWLAVGLLAFASLPVGAVIGVAAYLIH